MNFKNKGKKILITIIAASLFMVQNAFADPVSAGSDTQRSASYGPVVTETQENAAAAATYGPVTETAQSQNTSGMVVSGPGAVTSGVVVASGQTLLKTDDPVPLYVDDSIGLGGGRIIMIKGTQNAQQICLVVESPEGKRVVVDGGWDTNTDYLYRYLCENGGYVDAWLITHPHHDHAGALWTILSNPEKYPLDIRSIYATTDTQEFLRVWDGDARSSFMDSFIHALNCFDQTKLHRNPAAGTVLQLGSMEVKVINSPYLVEEKGNAGNNSSILYRITLGGKRFMVLGDIAYEASLRLLAEHPAEELKSDIVQLAHHGQHGGCPELYQTISPTVALWPSSEAIWSRTGDLITDPDLSYTPAVTMSWMQNLGVTKNYCMSKGNWMLK